MLVKNLAQSHNDHFEIGSRVVRAHIGFGHLILATSTHVYVYSVKNFNTPTILDLSPNARLVNIIQTHGYFCLVDTENGVRVFSHDGKLVSSPRWSGMKLETLGDGLISLSPEMVAIRDKMDERGKCECEYDERLIFLNTHFLFSGPSLRHCNWSPNW